MKIIIKNFFRNDVANLTIKSIRHFMPDVYIGIVNLYKNTFCDYNGFDRIIGADSEFYYKTKYHSIGKSVGNTNNCLFFTETFNFMYEKYRDYDEKILVLAEDHFFTTGQTLKELNEVDFDVAYAKWADGANGSLLCFNPLKSHRMFPIPEQKCPVEHILIEAIRKVDKHRIYPVSTRDGIDYKGDGIYANSVNEIKPILQQKGIL